MSWSSPWASCWCFATSSSAHPSEQASANRERRRVQDFFAAFGHDGIGTIGTPTTITSGDLDGILMIAAQALEKRTNALRAENAELKARLEILERRLGTVALTPAE